MSLSTTVAAQANIQFSGLARQHAPDGRVREANLYVGDNQVRLEHQRGGSTVVEIYDMEHQRLLLLVPEQKIYMERELPADQMPGPLAPTESTDPCSALPGGQCKKLASETLYGRSVSRWEVRIIRDGKPLNSMHWIDDERLMSLRDVWPDGSVSELTLAGKETLDGRPVEHWTRTHTAVDGKKKSTSLWYDPELRLAIREELPGGFFREITDIEVANQPKAIFRAPADYRRVEGTVETLPQEDR